MELKAFAVAAVDAYMRAALDGELGLVEMCRAFNFHCALSDLEFPDVDP